MKLYHIIQYKMNFLSIYITGHCVNWSDRFLCNYKADGATIDAEKNNQNLNGFFECKSMFN